MHNNPIIASLDFETYSEAGYIYDNTTKKIKGITSKKRGLGAVGTPNYAAHPSTEVLCLYYNLRDGRGPQLWLPMMPSPQNLFDFINTGNLIEAWNVTFEWYIWNQVCTRRYGWPPLSLYQCVCAMAKSRRYALPGALSEATQVLGVTGKDTRGEKLIKKLSVPVSPTKTRSGLRRTLATDYEDFLALYDYCRQDTIAEDAASALTPDLTDDERATWLCDQVINARGVRIDIETLDAALIVLAQVTDYYTEQLRTITDNAVCSVDENKNFREWILKQGVHIEDLKADTVTALLNNGGLPQHVLDALYIRQKLGSANVKKLQTLKLQVSSDGRLRNQYVYCGADRTGRFSSGGAQLQNLTSIEIDVSKCAHCDSYAGHKKNNATLCPRCGHHALTLEGKWNDGAITQAIKDIRQKDFSLLESVWGDTTEILCGVLRGLFIPKLGHHFICCDYTAVEAVIAACISGCQWRIDAFKKREDIYLRSASRVTKIDFEDYQRWQKAKGYKHPDRAKLGKPMELGLGFGGWINALRTFGWQGDDATAKEIVLAWRAASPEIEEMWGGQYKWCGPGKWDYRPEFFGLEGAAIQAILNPGETFGYRDINYHVVNNVLHCRLPSGRYLYYHRPRLISTVDKLNRGPAFKILFEGHNTDPKKGARGWITMEIYGGRFFENVVQAIAADLLAAALKRCEQYGYPIVMHTHDEMTAEMPLTRGSVDEMIRIMCDNPQWAAAWPIFADGWTGLRYKKD